MTIARLLPLTLAAAMLAACNGHGEHFTLVSASNTSIDNGAIKVVGSRVTLNPDHGPDATISSTGDFAVDGKPVDVTPTQRALLMHYYADAVGVRDHGLATGKAGAAIAGKALDGVAAGLAGGNSDSIGKRVDAQVARVKETAMKICDDLAGIRTLQNQLARQLPAFKPYGQLVSADSVDDCRED